MKTFLKILFFLLILGFLLYLVPPVNQYFNQMLKGQVLTSGTNPTTSPTTGTALTGIDLLNTFNGDDTNNTPEGRQRVLYNYLKTTLPTL